MFKCSILYMNVKCRWYYLYVWKDILVCKDEDKNILMLLSAIEILKWIKLSKFFNQVIITNWSILSSNSIIYPSIYKFSDRQ